MPGIPGVEHPALLLALEHVGGQALPRDIGHVLGELRALDGHHVRHERIEEPFFLRAASDPGVALAELAQLLAGFDAQLDAAVPEHFAGLALVHLGVDVQRGEQGIEG
jgi:hypothetical protein